MMLKNGEKGEWNDEKVSQELTYIKIGDFIKLGLNTL